MTWTKIKKNKEDACVFMLIILCIDAYVYIFFWSGFYFSNLINQVDLIKFPTQTLNTPSYILSAIIIFTLLTAVIFINMYFKPFINFTIVKKNEIAKINNALDKNFRMLLHIYKNSFVGIEKLSYMGGEYIKQGNVEKAEDIYDEIHSLSIDSIKRISQVLDLLRDVDGEFVPFHVYECIDKAIVKAAFGDNFILEKNYMSEYDMVLGNEFHITEVMLNLLINAREACVDTERPKIDISTFREGNLLVIEITDNGCGIQKENLKKIFRAFYSTKPRSQCGGIGINYVEKVVVQHHGGIDVKSQPGEYTTFQIYFPLISEKYLKG